MANVEFIVFPFLSVSGDCVRSLCRRGGPVPDPDVGSVVEHREAPEARSAARHGGTS